MLASTATRNLQYEYFSNNIESSCPNKRSSRLNLKSKLGGSRSYSH
jgi:hypothetical protein